MKTFKRALACGSLALALTAGPAEPVAAATVGQASFAGMMMTPGLGYPNSGSASGAVTFSSTICVGAAGGKQVAPGTCTVTGSGFMGPNFGFGPYCHTAAGTVWGTVVFTSQLGASVSANYQVGYIKVGLTIIGSGTAVVGTQTGPFTLIMTAPLPHAAGGQSCLSGTARDLSVTGTVKFSVA